MAWSLSRKVSAALLGILLSTMLMTTLLGYYKFEGVLSSLVNSRYSFVVFTIKRKIEDRLALGLPLRQLRQTQELVELEKTRDDQIVGIQIYDTNREVLFDTDRGAIGSRVPAAWTEPLTRTGTGTGTTPFSLRDEDMALVGLPLVNTLGKVEGAVVLRYPAAYLERQLGALLGTLAVEFAAILAGFSLIAIVASALLLRGVGGRLAAMGGMLARAAQPGAEPSAPEAHQFESRFGEFCDKAREAAEHIAEAEAEVERLDRLA